jgi:hypothetical protein
LTLEIFAKPLSKGGMKRANFYNQRSRFMPHVSRFLRDVGISGQGELKCCIGKARLSRGKMQ